MSVHMRETGPRFDCGCDYDLVCKLDLCFKVVAAVATASLPFIAHAQLAKADAVIGT